MVKNIVIKNSVTKKLVGLCGAVALATAAQSALAEPGQLYLGLDVLSTDFSGPGPSASSSFEPGQQFGDSDSGYGLHVGYGFSDWFAIELGLADFGRGTDKFTLRGDIFYIVKPNDTQTLDAKGLSLVGVFSKQLMQDWSVFGVLGVSAMDYKSTVSGGFSEQTGSLLKRDSYNDQGLVYGVGTSYQLSDQVKLRLDARRNDVGDFTLDTLGLAVEYQF